MTNRGLRINAPILDRTKYGETERLAILNCRYEEDLSHVLALRLQSYKHGSEYHVGRVNMRSVAWAEDLGRMTLIPASELLKAEKGLIEVTRSFEPNYRGVRCWLNLSIEANITAVRTWGEGMPRNCKRTSTSALVDAYDNTMRGGLGGLLECHSGELLFVAFGFQKNHSYLDDRSFRRLHAWLTLVSADAQLSDLLQDYAATTFYSGREAKVKIGDSRVVQAEIGQRRVLGEETFVCTVQQAQEPVEIYSTSDIYSASRKNTFAPSSSSVEEQSPTVGEFSEWFDSSAPWDFIEGRGNSGTTPPPIAAAWFGQGDKVSTDVAG